MPHKALANLLSWTIRELSGDPRTVVAQFTALSFDVSAQEILSALVAGKTVAVPDDEIRRDPNEFVRWLDQHQVNELFAPTLVLDMVCAAALRDGRALPRLRELVQAGEALVPSEAIKAFCAAVPGRRLHNHYGPAETHVMTSGALPEDVGAWPVVAPIGKPVDNARVY
ncbi:AMP-binding protein, partial [Streptomyces lucensis]|uniref:AMP-binding protein n=1 Tax=Streptomyces lucensis TaxID=67319 RepID=UPI001E3C905E